MAVDSPLSSSVVGQPEPVPMAVIRLGTSQNVPYNAAGGSSAISAQLGPSTEVIRIVGVGGNYRIRIGDDTVVATEQSVLCPTSVPQLFHVTPGQFVAVISDDDMTGAINIVEAISFASAFQ